MTNLSFREEKINIGRNYPIASRSGFKCGGCAEYYAQPSSITELKEVFILAKERRLPITVLGAATNILVSSDGVKGVVVSTTSLKGVSVKGTLVTALAGESLDSLINKAIEHNLTGLEELGGIPGTVGGAVSGNAGAAGKSVSDFFFYADCLDKDGNTIRVKKDSDTFSYRHSLFSSDLVVLTASFSLLPSLSASECRKKKEAYLKKRLESGQFASPSAGCIFKNPEGMSAGRLIDECGLKGKTVGKAAVSPYHANFILNTGGATAEDIYLLSELVREEVKAKTGYNLEYEIKLLGFKEKA